MRRIMIVTALALIGLVCGVAVAQLAPRSYTFTDQFFLRNSGGAFLLAKDQHARGVRVRRLNEHTIQITGHGSAEGAASAVEAVARQVRKLLDGMPDMRYSEVHGGVHAAARPVGDAVLPGVIGLLAGLALGLVIVVPRGRGGTAVPA